MGRQMCMHGVSHSSQRLLAASVWVVSRVRGREVVGCESLARASRFIIFIDLHFQQLIRYHHSHFTYPSLGAHVKSTRSIALRSLHLQQLTTSQLRHILGPRARDTRHGGREDASCTSGRRSRAVSRPHRRRSAFRLDVPRPEGGQQATAMVRESASSNHHGCIRMLPVPR